MLILRMEYVEDGTTNSPVQVAYATAVKTYSDPNGSSDYRVRVFNGERLWKETTVSNLPKNRIGWDLLAVALNQMLGERNGLGS